MLFKRLGYIQHENVEIHDRKASQLDHRTTHQGVLQMTRLPTAKWLEIRGEYEQGLGSCRELGEKHGINPETVSNHCKNEGWRKKKAELVRKATEKTVNSMSQRLMKHMSSVADYGQELLQEFKKDFRNRKKKKMEGWEDISRMVLATQRTDDFVRRALGANDAITPEEGMTPSNIAQQEQMLAQLRSISILQAQGKLEDIKPDIERMKRATIIKDI